jgi:hypothetical protein
VQLLATEGASVDADGLLAVGRAVADSIDAPQTAGEDDANWADRLLPTAGRVENSLEFAATDVFSLDFLKDVFTARYKAPAGEITLFIHRAPNAEVAAGLFRQYLEAIEQLDGKLVKREEAYAEGDLGGEYDIIFVRGRYFAGANAAPNLDEARRSVQALRDGLPE